MSETKNAMDYSSNFPVSTVVKDIQDQLVSRIPTTVKGKKRHKMDKKKSKPLHVKSSIQDIPNTILQMIFSYIEVRQRFRIELVCRKWRLIGKLLPWYNPTSLKFTSEIGNSSLSIPSNKLTDHILLALLSRCRICLKELEFAYQPIDYVNTTSRSISMVGKWCPNLEKLKLHGVPVDSGTLNTIASSCDKLKEFSLTKSRNSDFGDGVLSIMQCCKSLEAVEVTDVFLTDDWFKVVNPKLKKVELSVRILSPTTPLQNLIISCDSLEELHFSFDCDLSIDEAKMLFNIFNRFKRTLEKLWVYIHGNFYKYVNWCDGVKNLHQLLELSLFHGQSIDDRLITCIVKECPNLETLEIPGCAVTDRGATTLEALPLKNIDISCSRYISDKGLSFICKKAMLVKCSLSFMPYVTEDFCCSLARTCPELHDFDVSANGDKITNRVVNSFRLAIQRRFLQPPVKLIVGCTNVSTRVKRCSGLEVKFTSRYEDGFMKFKRKKAFSMKL